MATLQKKKKHSEIKYHVIMMLVCLLCVLPLVLVLSISFTDMDYIYKNGYSFWPSEFNAGAYEYIAKNPKELLDAYRTTIEVTVIGTFFGLLFTAMLAYPLSRRDYRFNMKLSFLVFFTLLFNGGLVPWYILISKYLQLKDHLAVLILPYLVYPWYVILLRTFFKSIPYEMIESAQIDGCGEWRTFWSIVLPLSKPALATVGLLIAFRYWNDWYLGMLFITDRELRPLQYLMYSIMANLEEFERNFHITAIMGDMSATFPSEPVRMAMAVLGVGPMLIVFPFFQKYFVRGLAVGAVKG